MPTVSAQTANSDDLLKVLASELSRVKGMPIGSYPKDFFRPELSKLTGINKEEVIKNLGVPDYIDKNAGIISIAYFYFNPTPGMRGGGGYALEILFDKAKLVKSAIWQLQR